MDPLATLESETVVADVNTQQQVENLNAGWTNFISQQMNLDPATFQLAQGTLGLQTADDSGLFLMQDAVPATSSVGYYDASSMKKRSDAFGMLINAALLAETGVQAFITAMGAYYADWTAYKAANKPTPGQSMMDYFRQYEMQSVMGINPKAEAALNNLMNAPLLKAQANFLNTANYENFVSGVNTFSLPRYAATAAAAVAAINASGASLTNINFNSQTADKSVSQFFASGAASGFYDIFSASAGVDFSSLNTKAASSYFSVTGYINSYTTLACGPGNWYSSAEVSRALNAKNDFTVWDAQASAGDWNSFFGQPNGSLARYISQLVLVSDYKLVVTSHASYSQEDYQQIRTHADVGIWPFFSASEDSTQTTDVVLNSDSTLSVTHTLPKGKIQIWGVNVANQS